MVAEETLNAQIIEKAWNDAEFKQKLFSDPHKAIREAFNIELPEDIQLTALEESRSHFFLVIPPNPKNNPSAGKAEALSW